MSIPELTLSVSARMLVADGGFKIADEPPNAEQLAFSKEIARRRRCQVMRWLAYQFSTIGARRWAGAWDRSWSATRMGGWALVQDDWW